MNAVYCATTGWQICISQEEIASNSILLPDPGGFYLSRAGVNDRATSLPGKEEKGQCESTW